MEILYIIGLIGLLFCLIIYPFCSSTKTILKDCWESKSLLPILINVNTYNAAITVVAILLIIFIIGR